MRKEVRFVKRYETAFLEKRRTPRFAIKGRVPRSARRPSRPRAREYALKCVDARIGRAEARARLAELKARREAAEAEDGR